MTTTTPRLIAFHGDPAIAEKYRTRVRAHRAADEIVQRYGYWQDGKGCAVGCTIHSDDHDAYETELGVPRAIAWLEDAMFESLPEAEARTWPERFLAAIPVGADLTDVTHQFLAWLMLDETYGVALTTEDAEIADLAAEVGLRLSAGDTVGPEAGDLAERLRAAWDARDARAAWAAWDARDAWAAAAWAAWDARDARAARDARDAFVKASSEVLLALLASAPVVGQERAA